MEEDKRLVSNGPVGHAEVHSQDSTLTETCQSQQIHGKITLQKQRYYLALSKLSFSSREHAKETFVFLREHQKPRARDWPDKQLHLWSACHMLSRQLALSSHNGNFSPTWLSGTRLPQRTFCFKMSLIPLKLKFSLKNISAPLQDLLFLFDVQSHM